MKNILRYFVPFLTLAFAFICVANKLDSAVAESRTNECASEILSYYSDISTPESDLYLPPRTYSAPVHRLHGTAKRINSSHKHKSNSEYIKAGRVISAAGDGFNYKKSLNIRTSFIEPAQRLISLGKLII